LNKIYVFFVLGCKLPKSGLDRLILHVSRSQAIRNRQPAGLLLTSDRLIVEAATYTTHQISRDERTFP